MAEQTVELAPAESKQVTFEAVPHEAKVYQVSVDGLSGSFKAIAIIITQYNITVDAPSQVSPGESFSVTFQIDIPQDQTGLIHAVDARLKGPEQGVTYAILNTGEVGRITRRLSLSATEWWTGAPLTPGTYNLETRFYKGGAGWGVYIWDWKSMVTIQVG